MRIKKFSRFDETSQPHVIRLAELMVDAGEHEFGVFFSQMAVLQNEGGTLLVAEIDNVEVGYMFLTKCVKDDDILKVYYFAIENSFRNKRIGSEFFNYTMKHMNKSRYVLCCQPNLESFYKKFGFVLAKHSTNDETISMTLNVKNKTEALRLLNLDYYQPSTPMSFERDYSEFKEQYLRAKFQ
jgi:predicted GNAT family N-acyltransferase